VAILSLGYGNTGNLNVYILGQSTHFHRFPGWWVGGKILPVHFVDPAKVIEVPDEDRAFYYIGQRKLPRYQNGFYILHYPFRFCLNITCYEVICLRVNCYLSRYIEDIMTKNCLAIGANRFWSICRINNSISHIKYLFS